MNRRVVRALDFLDDHAFELGAAFALALAVICFGAGYWLGAGECRYHEAIENSTYIAR